MHLEFPPDLVEIATRIRRKIHSLPELSNQESRTSEFLRSELANCGIHKIRMLDTHSFMVDIDSEQKAQQFRRIAIRADLDALPIQEETTHNFVSHNPGVMHACGHDGHMAVVAGLGIWFNSIRSSLPGSVRLIFQQSEEAYPLGSQNVIASGALDEVDGVIGLHVDPGIPAGQITVREGAFAASGDEFKIVVQGRSCHAAKPHEGVDAIAISASVIQEIQKIRSRLTDPQSPFVITVAKINGGVVTNIVCDEVVIEGTIRALDEVARQTAQDLLENISQNMAAMYGGHANVQIDRGEPVLMNEENMTELIRSAGRQVLGKENVLNLPPWAASDDFAYYGKIKPAVYFRLGVRNESTDCVYGLHHSKFDLDESAIPVGIKVIGQAVYNFMNAS